MVSLDPHVTAVVALLGAGWFVGRATPAALDALVAGGAAYGVLEPGQGVAGATSLTWGSDQRSVRFATRYFGTGWEAVDTLRTDAKAALLDAVPAVSGRTSTPIRHETEFPFDRDEDMPEPVLFTGDSWTFATWPA